MKTKTMFLAGTDQLRPCFLSKQHSRFHIPRKSQDIPSTRIARYLAPNNSRMGQGGSSGTIGPII